MGARGTHREGVRGMSKHRGFNYRAAIDELRPHLAQRILRPGDRPKRRPPRRRRPAGTNRMKQLSLWPEERQMQEGGAA